jgi:poly-gamma-glutamate synthesis protein (capsule biosynthesis protein)
MNISSHFLRIYGGKFLFLICLLKFTQAGAASAAPEETLARAIFIGDVMVHERQLQGARRSVSWDFAPQFRRVKPLFGDALVAANLETVFAGEKSGFAGYPSFNTPDDLACALTDLGVNVVTLANNHILDRGFKGAARTTETLDAAGIKWTGLAYGRVNPSEPLLVEHGGLRWAFVNYSYGSNSRLESNIPSGDVYMNVISDESVKEGLRNAGMSSPDVTVACFHWGNEYQYAPTDRQREIAALSLENGADIVIGTHPHVLQPIEIKGVDPNRSLVAYSLGNFVSSQRTTPRERSVILAVDVKKIPDGKARIMRVSVAPTWVAALKRAGRPLMEVIYAGESARFNHAGLASGDLKKARDAGKSVLDFLGATTNPDEEGFYTLWEASSPDELPKGRRRSPE